MANWTQPCCEACWVERNLQQTDDGGWTMRIPVRVTEARLTECCYCGNVTFVGIFLRVDPTQVPFPAPDNED